MKKYLLVLLSVLAIVAFATTAFALHEVQSSEYTPSLVKAGKAQIELGGEIRIRGEVNNNLTDFDSDLNDGKQAYDERVRLGVKATVSPNTFAYIQLESGSGSTDTFTWGSFNSKQGSMDIRQAYISANLGKVATLKAGHMLLALGNNLFFDHTKYGDDAILLSIPAGDGELTLLDIKLVENDTTSNDDIDGYVAAYGTSMGGTNLSADITYLRSHDKHHTNSMTGLTSTADGWYLWNLGLRADADLSGVKVKGDVELQTGNAKDVDAASGDDVKARGFAAMLGAEIPAGPASVRVNAAYGSGDKIDTDNKNEAFQTFLGDDQYYTYVYDYKAITAAGSTHTGLSNTWYLNAGVTAKPTTDLKLLGDVYYLRASRKVSDAEDSLSIGTELDAKAEYAIDKDLVYYVEAGYLWAGDLYKNVTGGEDPDNPYSIRHGLLLKF
jgi:hypothetical protein